MLSNPAGSSSTGPLQRVLVTGGAGFIGSHFVDHALARGAEVVVFDNLSTGQIEFLESAKKHKAFRLITGDIRELAEIEKACLEFRPTLIAHFAANADVRHGLEQPRRDLDYNTIGTWNVAESARRSGCQNLIFSSTGSVYGEPDIFPTPETCPFPTQTSLYAASKLAGEGILSAYSVGYGLNATVFRFVSILGPRYTHGHVYDFVRALKKDPTQLRVLGNGLQLKSYLHVEDLMVGLFHVLGKMTSAKPGFQVYNIGHEDALTVNKSIDHITSELNLNPKRDYSGGERGWIGDSPRIQLSIEKLKATGWKPQHSLEKGVRDTVRYLLANEWLFGGAK